LLLLHHVLTLYPMLSKGDRLLAVIDSCEISEGLVNSTNMHVSMYVSCHYNTNTRENYN
jgi:hypothetical protein